MCAQCGVFHRSCICPKCPCSDLLRPNVLSAFIGLLHDMLAQWSDRIAAKILAVCRCLTVQVS